MHEITQASQWEQSFETLNVIRPIGARSKMGQAVDDGGPLPDHLRTMKSQTANKGGAMALTLAQMIADARSQAREISPTQAAQARNSAGRGCHTAAARTKAEKIAREKALFV